eukprot:3290624-Amphidinium_carterae.1
MQSVRPATAQRYMQAVSAVRATSRARGGHWRTEAAADALLEVHLDKLFVQGGSQQNAKDAVYGLAWFAGFATKGLAFPRAKQALKAWRRMEPETSREPVSWAETLVLADTLATEHALAAAAVLIAFDGYLRPSTCLGLSTDQVVRPRGKGALNQCALVLFPRAAGIPSKVNAFDDTVIVGESEFGREWVRTLCLTLLKRPAAGPLFCGLQVRDWNRLIKTACT